MTIKDVLDRVWRAWKGVPAARPSDDLVGHMARSGPNGTGRSFTRISAAFMPPPWRRYPDIPLGSIGWRMGAGEEYLISFDDWLMRQQPADRTRYVTDNPEPASWQGFYACRITGGQADREGPRNAPGRP